MPGPHHRPYKTAAPQNIRKTLVRILGYTSGYKLHLILMVFGILGSVGANIAGTYFLKPIINDYIVPLIGQKNPDLSGFVSLLITLGAIYLFGVGCTFLYNRLMLGISTGTLLRIRTDLFSHMQTLPIKYFDTHTHGELMSRFTNDTDTLREMLSQGIPQLFSSFLSVTGVFIMMLILSPILTILIVLMLFVMILTIRKIGGRSAKAFQSQQAALGKINGYIEEIMEGQKVVKVFCREEQAGQAFDRLNDTLCDSAKNAHTFANILMPIMQNLSYVNYALSAAAGGILSIYGYMDLGTIGSFLQYTRTFSQPIMQISQQFNSVLSALAGAERIFSMIDEPPENDNGTVTLVHASRTSTGEWLESSDEHTPFAWKQMTGSGIPIYTEAKGDVRFDNVVFSYGREPVLNGISLYAKPGQKIALVGSTGAGKTTITNLLNRFYDVPDNKITYDGIDINQIKKEALRRSLSMVLQDVNLFTGTVMENIRYGNLSASDEDVIRAAKLTDAHPFIRHLPQGYQTLLTANGANLSQGQRQLLSIARAAVANPPVLILDEATSSIDTRTEKMIEKGMDTLMEGKTVFVIAHRLSTVQNANAIMVLERGEIIERGDHDDLIAEKGRYYQLYTGAFELD